MAKKKETTAFDLPIFTLDGYQVEDLQNITREEIEYLTGKVGEHYLDWFIDGKRNTGFFIDQKDLILN